MSRTFDRSDRYKAQILDYDFIFGKADDDHTSVCLSWRERQALLSVIDPIGWATRWDKASGEVDSDEVEQLRNQIAHKLMGECPVDCNEVIACILADMDGEGDFYAAILAWLIEQMRNNSDMRDIIQGQDPTDVPLDGSGDNLLGGFGCDLDLTFGFALQFTQFMNNLVMDFYQILEVATNWMEALAAASDIVPVLTEFTDYLVYVQDNLIENYEANYDQALENQIACELMCLAIRENCTLSWEMVYFYLGGKVNALFQEITVSDLITYIVAGVWDGDDFVYVSMLMLATVLHYGGDWSGVTLEDIQRIVTSLLNDPNEDWEQLCDVCTPWEATFDFTDSDCGWTTLQADGMNGAGNYVVDTGWEHVDTTPAAEYRRSVSVGLDITAFRMFEVTTTFLFTKGNFDFPATMAQQILASGDVQVQKTFTQAEEGSDVMIYVHKAYGVNDVVNLTASLRCHSVFTSGFAGAIMLKEFTVKGYGSIPQEIIDNSTTLEYQ